MYKRQASTPTGVFNQWFKALFSRTGTLSCRVCHPVHQLLPHWPAAALPTPLHNPPPRWVCQPPPSRESSLPRLPVSAPPTSLDKCFFFISLVVRLPYSSSCVLFLNCCCPFGCARRHRCLPMPPSWLEVICFIYHIF